MADRTDPLREALEALLDFAGEEAARDILREVGRAGVRAELERLIARRFAVQLLNDSAPRLVVRDRLVSRGLNMRTAYRVIDAALNERDPTFAK